MFFNYYISYERRQWKKDNCWLLFRNENSIDAVKAAISARRRWVANGR
jgi:hypothetical protein